MNSEIYGYKIPTPLGEFYLTCQGGSIIRASFDADPIHSSFLSENPIGREACLQLTQYFQGERLVFDLPLNPEGSGFLKKMWKIVSAIPAGETISYSEMARIAGIRNGSRAVGMAMARNPILIFIPCHRVVSSKSSLTGYAGGIDRKRKLLEFERKFRTQKGSGLLF